MKRKDTEWKTNDIFFFLQPALLDFKKIGDRNTVTLFLFFERDIINGCLN